MNPDALVPIPENDEPLLEGITEAPCEQIRSVAEDLQLIPPQLCPLLDNEEFRQICGCENTLAPSTPPPAPLLTRAPVPPPTPAPALFESGQGQLCCVCFDDCVSTITNPDALVPIPENDEPLLEGITEAPCEQIRSVAEDLQLIPPQLCPLLDNEEFRQICGCENTLAPPTPPPVPPPTPPPVPPPTLPPGASTLSVSKEMDPSDTSDSSGVSVGWIAVSAVSGAIGIAVIAGILFFGSRRNIKGGGGDENELVEQEQGDLVDNFQATITDPVSVVAVRVLPDSNHTGLPEFVSTLHILVHCGCFIGTSHQQLNSISLHFILHGF